MELESKIEAFLFWKGEPQTEWEIAVAMRVDPSEIPPAILKLEESLRGRGVTLVRHGDKVMLGTSPEMSHFFEELRKEELNKDLSKAALETLSIILYKDSVTRSEINFIRGVNSGYILRNLEVRGLVERVTHKSDARMYVYKPTLELLSYLGVSSVKDLPQFETIQKTLEIKLSGQEKVENEN
jgi:segregation and condensation protein B